MKNNNLIILTLAFGMFLWSFSAGIVNISLPTISQFLDISTSTVSLIIIVHLIVLISFLLIFGRVGDIVGYKKVFLSGISLFTLGAYFCGISLDITSILIFRIFQGIGSAMLLSVTPAIISVHLPQNMSGKVFGIISLTTTLGLSSGYGIGGLITEYGSWNWIFLVTVPLGIAIIILSATILPKSRKSKQKTNFDVIGAILIFTTLLTLILPLYIGQSMNWSLLENVLTLSISLTSGIIFFAWESQHKDPLIDLSILKNTYIALSLISGFLVALVLNGSIFLLPFYFELIMGYSSDFSGLIILLPSLAFIFIGPLSGYISDKIGSRIPTITAVISLIIAVILLTLFNETIGMLFIFIALGIRAISEGMFTPANNKLIMSHSTNEKRGSLSSLLNTARYLGLVMGVVVFNSIFNYTINIETAEILGVPLNGAYQLSAPTEILLNGFHNAFIVGLVLSIIIFVFSILTREDRKTDEDKFN